MKLHSAPLEMYFSKSTFSLKLPEFVSKPLTIEIVHGFRQESEIIDFGKSTSQGEQKGTNFSSLALYAFPLHWHTFRKFFSTPENENRGL